MLRVGGGRGGEGGDSYERRRRRNNRELREVESKRREQVSADSGIVILSVFRHRANFDVSYLRRFPSDLTA